MSWAFLAAEYTGHRMTERCYARYPQSRRRGGECHVGGAFDAGPLWTGPRPERAEALRSRDSGARAVSEYPSRPVVPEQRELLG
ncbi:hypothetical protein HPB47_000915 [Ixodes persulcatus]|uniref:Uncharacterized protein n=1 Tax=Ixodes persulcatus TaxID=34615 RepID=A0AC60PS44_IXOPE|nr:hypothetical protein HPB47_000915 [Ixodes persulcatus]